MNIETAGSAQIRHRDTGDIFEIDSSDLNWELSSTEDRSMGRERIYSASIFHPELGLLEWVVSEYPAGRENFVSADVGEHQVLSSLSIKLEEDPDAADADLEDDAEDIKEWFHKNYDIPENLLPYESATGGYQWIHGGPVSALEAISDAFSGGHPEWLLNRVAKEIETESGGVLDWTPKAASEDIEEAAGDFSSSDFAAGDFFTGASDHQLDLFEQLQDQPNVSRELAEKLQSQAADVSELLQPLIEIEKDHSALNTFDGMAGMGHNGPPSPLEELGFTPDYFSALGQLTQSLAENTKALEASYETRAALDASLLEQRNAALANTEVLEAQTRAIEANTDAVRERTETIKKLSIGGAIGAGAWWTLDKVLGNALGKIGDKLGEKVIAKVAEKGKRPVSTACLIFS